MQASKGRKRSWLIAACVIAPLLATLGIGVRSALAYASITDLPFIGSHQVTCSWHEACTDPPTAGSGIDFAMNYGETIYAAGAGTVYASGWDSTGWGNQVVLRHPDGSGGYYYTRYAHLVYYFPPTGAVVGNGSPIGYADSTGNSTGNHLHFEMYHNGLSSSTSIHFTPIYGLRGSGQTYNDSYFDDWDWVNHDRFDGSTPTLDDRDTQFSTVNWWSTASYGFDRGGLSNALTHWTYSNGSTVDSRAYWSPNLPASRNYAIYVFVPTNYANTTNAHYVIKSGSTYTHRYINQNPYYNDWVLLGTYYGQAGTGYLTVELRDDTGEAPGSKDIAADAIMFVPQ
ncbi:MAG: hypothetical protein COW33_02765 [Anaerolineae bacterium CG17_big_fil_post_rev_8_21_14_2_50_57_27]|nr:MAG: hypothetical protein COW33_02765 [Anaerolineae bacterium CG17_big_fil_post_rev_8_21_14_2_50_57_27]PJH75593.1 MAG: hypothetical protein CO064_05825 [Anaerolineae bacterium CG_4_9_14_0_8_um_filter_58_9]